MRNYILLGAFLLLLATGGVMAYSKIRGIRNNNPGNIRKTNDKWKGLAPVQDDPAFFKFIDAKFGIRAILVLLTNYYKRYGINTVNGLISRWAPHTENPTTSYVDYVARKVGVNKDDIIDVYVHRIAIAKAIVTFENGINPYGDNTFMDAEALI